MTRKIITTVLAAAITVTTLNVSTAQAGEKEAFRFIVGATALAIIGSAIAAEQNKQRKPQAAHAPAHNPAPRPQVKVHKTPNHGPKHGHDHGYNHRHHKDQWKKKNNRRTLARACLMTLRGHRGWTEGYALRCAQKTTHAALPSDCVRRNYAQGPRLFYSPRCLRRNGFDA